MIRINICAYIMVIIMVDIKLYIRDRVIIRV